jgi:hypothetical protein
MGRRVKALEDHRIRTLGRRLGLRSALHRTARELGYDLVKRHYYSEVPDLDSLPSDIWTAKRALRGVDFDIEAGLRLLHDELGEFIAEFEAPALSTGDPRDFYYQNTFYEGLDAETLYAMVRRHRPRRVLELGSGMSTLVIAKARRRNGLGDSHHDVYDPYSRPELQPALNEICALHPVSANDVPLAQFTRLEAGDFLFVDTTHTVKIGSDVNRLILEVLPTLAPGVLVHFHDIYLPYEYPIEFFTELGFSWAEQYLLQAFLAFNPTYEVLLADHALWRMRREDVRPLFPGLREGMQPGAFWIARTDLS